MRKEYDFSKAQRNPYARRLKQQVTIRLEHDTINLYLRECASSRKRLAVTWRPAGQGAA